MKNNRAIVVMMVALVTVLMVNGLVFLTHKENPTVDNVPTVVVSQPTPSIVPTAPVQTPPILVLAKKSGCLTCHGVDKKIVGPSWKDVAARYKDDPGAKARLITKVKTGGKGNWTEITGGIPMPPYSPRVADKNIEKLVDFILTL